MNKIIENIKDSSILIVDDNSKNTMLLQGILATDGYSHIHSLDSGLKVEPFLAQNNVDLILLDLNMPEFNGFEVLRMIKEKYLDRQIPVIIVSAQTDQQSKVRALKIGAKDFITKPVDRFESLNRIANTLEGRKNYLKVLHQNETLEEMVEARTAQLQDVTARLTMAHRDTLRRLTNAAALRDNETGFHLLRMTHYSCYIARTLGWPEPEIEFLYHSAPMHDIGKIAIPDSILLKPGKLTPEEFEVMKTHVTRGADMLKDSSSDVIQMAEKIAISHHEKWDGTGYPYGLKGQDIPLVGRIVSVADCFDALTSERPYKKAWPVQEAVDYLNTYSGIWFDPTVIDAFNRCLPRILEVKNKFRDSSE